MRINMPVSQQNFDFPGDNEVTVTTTMAARSWDDKGDNTSFIVNAQPETSQRRFSFKDISGLKLNGEQVGEDNACVDSFNLQFDNAVQTQRCINNGAFVGNVIPTIFGATGSITIAWSAASYALWIKQQTGGSIALSFTLESTGSCRQESRKPPPSSKPCGSRPRMVARSKRKPSTPICTTQ